MQKRITIKISPSGEIQAETQGIKGKKCAAYIEVIERLLQAQTVDSAYTREFYEPESNEVLTGVDERQQIKPQQ